MIKPILYALPLALVCLLSCTGKKSQDADEAEDIKAKHTLQGIWLSEEDSAPVMLVQGDSIHFPNGSGQTVAFKVVNDSLMMLGVNARAYAIEQLSDNVLLWKTASGEVVKMTKSTDEFDEYAFDDASPALDRGLNQDTIIKRDTTIAMGDITYHHYVQVNPTTYKVAKTVIGEGGVSLEHVYHENIVHLAVYKGSEKILSRDFHKNDFAGKVQPELLKGCILNDVKVVTDNRRGICFQAELAQPESPSSILVDIKVGADGTFEMALP